MTLIRKAFKRLHYPVEIIALCVRWYLAYALSLRNLEEMMAERGINVDHSTLHRWVLRLVPLLSQTFRQHKRPVGPRWRMDEAQTIPDGIELVHMLRKGQFQHPTGDSFICWPPKTGADQILLISLP